MSGKQKRPAPYDTRENIDRLRKVPLQPSQKKCFFCGTRMGNDRTKEHLIPVSKGGSGQPINIRWAHERCNNAAGDLDLDEKMEIRRVLHMYTGMVAEKTLSCYCGCCGKTHGKTSNVDKISQLCGSCRSWYDSLRVRLDPNYIRPLTMKMLIAELTEAMENLIDDDIDDFRDRGVSAESYLWSKFDFPPHLGKVLHDLFDRMDWGKLNEYGAMMASTFNHLYAPEITSDGDRPN